VTFIATRSATPRLTMFLTAVRRKSWRSMRRVTDSVTRRLGWTAWPSSKASSGVGEWQPPECCSSRAWAVAGVQSWSVRNYRHGRFCRRSRWLASAAGVIGGLCRTSGQGGMAPGP
jgi:hypothetical protein